MPGYNDEPYRSVLAMIVDEALRCEFQRNEGGWSVTDAIQGASGDMFAKYEVLDDIDTAAKKVEWPNDPKELNGWVRRLLPYRSTDIENRPSDVPREAWHVIHRIKAILWTVVGFHIRREETLRKRRRGEPKDGMGEDCLANVPRPESEEATESRATRPASPDVLIWAKIRLEGTQGEEKNRRAKRRAEARSLVNENCEKYLSEQLSAWNEQWELGLANEQIEIVVEASLGRPGKQAAKDQGMSPAVYSKEKRRLIGIFLEAINKQTQGDRS